MRTVIQTFTTAAVGAGIIVALAMLFLAAWPPQVRAAECLTVEWWNTSADAHDYKAVGVFSRAFVEAMKAASANPMPPEMAAAAKVAGWIGPSGNEIVLHFFDADGCDVGRWSYLTPEQLHAILASMGPRI